MKKSVLLIILGVITIGCIIFGTIKHVGGGLKTLREHGIYIGHDDSAIEEGYGSGNIKGTVNQNLDKFSSIKIDASIMEVTIEEGDKLYFESNFTKEWLRPKVSVENGKLEIKQGKQKRGINGGNNNCRVVITIPSGTKLSDIDINSNVGDLRLRKLEAEKIDLKLNVGEVSVRNVSFDKIDVDNNVGEVRVEAEGNLDDYDISASTDVGEVRVDGHNYKRSYNQRGSGSKSIKINTNVGEINVN